jgi:CheY-like chemotaxis protein
MNPRVIVAEDDLEMLAWLVEVLEKAGAEVIAAKSGAEVLDVIINQGRINLAVVDVHIPPPSGLRVVALARLAGFTGPFILITAFPDPSLEQSCMEMASTAMLAKPFDAKALVETAKELGFDRPQSARAWGKLSR